MGLVGSIRRAIFSKDKLSTDVPAAHFMTEKNYVYAPATGLVVSLSEINDAVISAGFFGSGCGILPQVGVIYAPVSGTVSVTTVTNHAIGLRTDSGMNLLIHIGIDTVKMNGNGFSRLVEMNQKVEAGTPLIVFDRDKIAAAGYEDVVTCVITNNNDYSSIDNIATSGTLIGTHPLVKVGDPLLAVK